MNALDGSASLAHAPGGGTLHVAGAHVCMPFCLQSFPGDELVGTTLAIYSSNPHAQFRQVQYSFCHFTHVQSRKSSILVFSLLGY